AEQGDQRDADRRPDRVDDSNRQRLEDEREQDEARDVADDGDDRRHEPAETIRATQRERARDLRGDGRAKQHPRHDGEPRDRGLARPARGDRWRRRASPPTTSPAGSRGAYRAPT